MSHHIQILRVARAGNPARALRLFSEQGLDQRNNDPKLLTLHGRLLKERALQCSEGRRKALLQDASTAYLAAFECEPDTYPLINAAALGLLAGTPATSRKYAQRVLDMIEADPNEGETPYWREATRAEALLLLDRPAAAKNALAAAIEMLPLAHEDLAATIGQFEAIIAAQNGDLSWLEVHRPPSSLHFSGLIGLNPNTPDLRDTIQQKIAQLRPGYAFGALAAGADIMIAEAALEEGAQLHVVLPNPPDAFRIASVEPYGAEWCARFDTLIEEAATVEALPERLVPIDCSLSHSIELASLVCMGQALRNAANLHSKAYALTIAAPDEEERLPITRWLESGRSLELIETTRQNNGVRGNVSQSTSQLAGLVLLTAPDQAQVDVIAKKHDAINVGDQAECMFTAPLKNSLELIRECLDADPGCRTSLVIDDMDMTHPDKALMVKIRLIAQGGEFGRFSVDRNTALVAILLDQTLKLEETGELASLYGPISLWAGSY